jgi:predicted neutral ceramidase superfamily lipid hydrolase
MHFGKLGRGEVIASICGVILAFSVFMDWYATQKSDHYSEINGKANVSLSAWETQSILRFLFLAAAAAPLILAWVVIRDHKLSWPRGELTAVVSVAAIVLILVAGFVSKPGAPADTISLQIGWIVALAAAFGMLIGSVQRTAESSRARKPPGTL